MPVTAQTPADRLDTPEAIAAYLNATLNDRDDDGRLLIKALRDVAEAQGGVTQLAERADPVQAALFRIRSSQRYSQSDILSKVIGTCGNKLRFAA